MTAVDCGIYRELGRAAGALRVDIEGLLADGLGLDDRPLAPQYAELMDRLRVVEDIARGPMPDVGLLITLVAGTTDLLPMSSAAREFVTAGRAFLVAARASLAEEVDL